MQDNPGGARRGHEGKAKKGRHVRCGIGGGFSCCSLDLADNCESEAVRNLSMLNLWCLVVSSWTGGESGLSNGSPFLLIPVVPVPLGASSGGSRGSRGSSPVSAIAARAEAEARTPSGTEDILLIDSPPTPLKPFLDGGGSSEFAGNSVAVGLSMVVLRLGSTRVVCRRISFSLAITPRRRRKGIVDQLRIERIEL